MSKSKKNSKTIYDGIPAGVDINAETAKAMILNSNGNPISIDKTEKESTEKVVEMFGNTDKKGRDLEIETLKTYNESIEKEQIPLYENIKLNGNNLLVCLYKHIPYTSSGLYNPIQVRYQTEGGKIQSKNAELQYINYGVIVNMTGTYSEHFKENFRVGDHVALKLGINLDQLMFFPDIRELAQENANLYTNFKGVFKINENMIENGFTNNGK